ncbi:GNAT family N-acetyltransferase [Cellulomonas sp. PhB143]|uniref:GNAT family N-acetyltransferase n=1 Tax=Cellulomonas sp. PhB143 TaxID=2485186 RepID=UPI000F4908EA|nr:GNAT family N-acetyltransferase [Cellulomonas sp. PhB143]ROS74406.1 ribosomal protein S18 acetylase RimI-like enzyme [Cellulomonas sp. PhB143]
MRPGIEVRRVTGPELPALARISTEARAESLTGSQVCTQDEAKVVRQLSVLLEVDGGAILAAYLDDVPVGFVLTRVVRPTIFDTSPALHIEAIYVSQTARRRGAGHALLTAVADLAEEAGAVDVFSVPIPGARGVQRFLARVGFAPAAGHRVVATATLKRRLAADPTAKRRGSKEALDDLIARRRKARTEGLSGPVDLRSFQRSLAEGGEDSPGTPAGAEPRDLVG